ncbi:MAG: lipoyl synthase [Cyanobacteria bacterium HKST-UBA06]|nr:lipoyl synthase [Cyanobacteria bacterium HKST-UBA06]
MRKPDWLKIALPKGGTFASVKSLVTSQQLATVCQEARCPNIGECWAGGTATLMLMGDTCTRACKFCHINTGNPKGWLDDEEPAKVLHTVKTMGLRYVVLTSVDRDDLPDGGADHFARTVATLKTHLPDLMVETLIPDFSGRQDPLRHLMASHPDVVAQNIETVRRLTHPVRDPRAGYEQTLGVLRQVKAERPDIYTKSSLMLGLGETDDEVLDTLKDLRAVGTDIVTLGQYLQPSKKQLPVQRYVTPDAFRQWETVALDLGFMTCAAGPLVRSSYKAAEQFLLGLKRQRAEIQAPTDDSRYSNRQHPAPARP